ncbi:hypothetical protein C8J56DRAFT_1059371 [Mycena floridula]|nr:hypothetical protein C8J56DRAFT_1059371 [Mycena floridula]
MSLFNAYSRPSPGVSEHIQALLDNKLDESDLLQAEMVQLYARLWNQHLRKFPAELLSEVFLHCVARAEKIQAAVRDKLQKHISLSINETSLSSIIRLFQLLPSLEHFDLGIEVNDPLARRLHITHPKLQVLYISNADDAQPLLGLQNPTIAP